MEYKLTASFNNRQNRYYFFLNGVKILSHKGSWMVFNAYLLDSTIYEELSPPYPSSKTRKVQRPVSKEALTQFDIPKGQKIELTY